MRKIRDVVQEIKERAHVAEWISQHAEVRRGGKNTLVKCPFCGSESFKHGRAQEKHYRCYREGCPTGGRSLDIISLASMLRYGREPEGEVFMQVIHDLCDELGIAPPSNQKRSIQSPEDRRRSMFRDAVWFWTQRLQDDDDESRHARDYLAQRGIAEEQIKKKNIGYAPRGKRLTSYLLKKGYTKEELMEGSLTNQRGHDFFQGRVIVPVNLKGSEGTVYGRDVLGSDSSFRHLYLRGREMGGLYGLQKAKTALLSEGIFDALVQERAHQEVGLPEVFGEVCSVATYGTQGFREEYVQHLQDHGIERVVIAADADTPGLMAARRTAELLHEHFVVTIALFPAGHDPNSYYLEYGSVAWREVIERAVPLVDLEVLVMLKQFDLSKRTEKVLAFQQVEKHLRKYGHTIRELTMAKLGDALGVSTEAVRKDLQKRERVSPFGKRIAERLLMRA